MWRNLTLTYCWWYCLMIQLLWEKLLQERIQEDGKVGSTRNLSSHLDNNCTCRIFLMTDFGNLVSCNFPRKSISGNFSW